MVYISILEDSIAPKMKEFENTIRGRWRTLPHVESNAIYHQCPYFGLLLGDINDFFEIGVMRIVHDIVRQYNDYARESLELTWFDVSNNYNDLIEGYCTPFADAFEAASSGGINRLNQARMELNHSAITRRHGYITNDFTFFLAAETFAAISDAIRSVENDHKAWQVATATQQAMHNRLSALWNKQFESVFMKQIEVQNVFVTREIIKELCRTSNISYQAYLDAKSLPDFKKAKSQFIVGQRAQKAAYEQEKLLAREKIVAELKMQLADIDSKLESFGFSLLGKKRKERKALEERKEQLSAEIQATIKSPRLPSRYLFNLPMGSPAHKEFSARVWVDASFKKDWTFVYSAEKKYYIAYMPDGKPLFTFKGDFLRIYGHGRFFGGRYETIADHSGDAIALPVWFALFEK